MIEIQISSMEYNSKYCLNYNRLFILFIFIANPNNIQTQINNILNKNVSDYCCIQKIKIYLVG